MNFRQHGLGVNFTAYALMQNDPTSMSFPYRMVSRYNA